MRTHRRFLRILKRLAVLLLFLFVCAAAWAYWHDQAPSDAPMDEVIAPNEDYLSSQIIASSIDISVQSRDSRIADYKANKAPAPTSSATNPGYSPYHFTRDAHPKGHGCVSAKFTVNNHIDQQYAYGVFAPLTDGAGVPQTSYDALIRFSAGKPTIAGDSKWNPLKFDVQGMAIKLFHVPGDKLLPGEENDSTQDFVLMNNPVFFIRTLQEYADFNRLVAGDMSNSLATEYFLHGGIFNILNWHAREFLLAIKAQKPRPASLLTTRFYSGTAYLLGPRQYVKYGVIPCSRNRALGADSKGVDSGTASADYLRLELAKQAQQGGACFDFAVQPQVAGKNMPVEDTTVEWSEKDSPFVRLARIEIPKQDNNTEAMNTQCENTAFNPWHALADHKPVGVMNRIRETLYQAMSRFRQTKNCGASCPNGCNPKGDADNGDSLCPAAPAAPAQ